MAIECKVVDYRFGPGDTIRAVIRRFNHQNMTPLILDKLLKRYNEINGNHVPKLGEETKVPIFVGFLGIDKQTTLLEKI